MSKTLKWEWAISLGVDDITDQHLQAAYKLNWDNLCKFDTCRKNCKKILCLACFDKSWIENDSANNSGYDNFDTTDCEQKRKDLTSYVGLKNLGATCYVNCLLQLWFHNPALRKAIYEWNFSQQHETKTSKQTNKETKTIEQRQYQQQQHQPYQEEQHQQQNSDSKSNSVTIAEPEKDEGQVAQMNSDVGPPNTESKVDKYQQSPIEQLQLIFARLQFTNKKSIDPFSFIESLALDAAEQQDAQEFGNLFMEFLEKSFANDRNPFVSKIIQRQFCGRYSYATICDHCKHSSLSDSKFYELDLSIQNFETLHDCLNEFFRPVPLDGKYNCSHCKKAQSAHRKIILKSLPPTLNLQLLRFVFDVQKGVRQKLNSYIIFPEVLDMSQYLNDPKRQSDRNIVNESMFYRSFYDDGSQLNGLSPQAKSGKANSSIYLLSAVLIHRGSSPHSGHYIAHIKDRVTKDWYKFNDDSVERIGPQLQVSADGESITIVEDKNSVVKTYENGKATRLESKSLKSKTAYMLVYQAQDNEALTYPSDNSNEWYLPEHLQQAVCEENSRCDEIFESLKIAKEVDQQLIDARKQQIRRIYEKLVCRSQSDSFEFIDKSWLQRWLTNSSSSAKFPAIDNTKFMCIHEKLDFRKIDQVKCVRTEGADMLYEEFGGGPRLQDAMCRECVALEVKLMQLKERMKEDQKFITSQAKFKLDADYDFNDAYIVGKNSYRDWQALAMANFKKSHPDLMRRKNAMRVNNHHSSDEDDQKQDKDTKENQTVATADNDDGSDSDSDDEELAKYVFNSDIICEHNELLNDTQAWRIVPKEVWLIFNRYFGYDPEKPLIERNANTIMCPHCKRQEAEQQSIGDIQKQKASEQKQQLLDLFHNKKRASWCTILPGQEYYALNREFLTKWQKFLRNPCTQEQPTGVKNKDVLVCEHGKSVIDLDDSNPLLSECPFVLITPKELETTKKFYDVDHVVKFSVDPVKAEKKISQHIANEKSKNTSGSKTSVNISGDDRKESSVQNFASAPITATATGSTSRIDKICSMLNQQRAVSNQKQSSPNPMKMAANSQNNKNEQQVEEEIDLTEFDWSDCVVSDPEFCSSCYEKMKQNELKKLLNYESATIYITKVENINGPHNNLNSAPGGNTATNEHCDTGSLTLSNSNYGNIPTNTTPTDLDKDTAQGGAYHPDIEVVGVQEAGQQLKRRGKRAYPEDEANEFVPPPGTARSSTPANSGSMLRRTTRRNRNREQAYTIKPTQTLLELKKDIFTRCQVLPVDQRLFLNDVLLENNNKTMAELSIVPNCSLKLEVDKPLGDTIDLIGDEPKSRKSCAQPETGFKGSLLLSNSHF